MNFKCTLFITLIVVTLFSACEYQKLKPYGEGCTTEVSYSKDIVPIINHHCVSCHFTNNASLISDFSNYAGMEKGAKNGSLKLRVIDLKDMPQGQGTIMNDDERNKIHCWIKQGALNN